MSWLIIRAGHPADIVLYASLILGITLAGSKHRKGDGLSRYCVDLLLNRVNADIDECATFTADCENCTCHSAHTRNGMLIVCSGEYSAEFP